MGDHAINVVITSCVSILVKKKQAKEKYSTEDVVLVKVECV